MLMLSPRTVRSNRILALGLVLFFFCNVYLWPKVQSSITQAANDNGYEGPVDDLKVLDLRFSYSPATVSNLFSNWQYAGCRIYLFSIFADALIYVPGYGIVLLVLMNRLGPYVARKTGNQAAKNSYQWVVAVMAVDLVENVMEYLLVTTYMAHAWSDTPLQQKLVLPPWWATAVRLSSLATSIKWCMVYLGVLYSVVLAVVAVGMATGLAGQQNPAAMATADKRLD